MNGFLLAIAVKGTAVLACCGLATLAARRSSAAIRHLIWVAGVCSLLVLPGFSLLAPAWEPALPRGIEAVGTVTRTVVDVTAEAAQGTFALSTLVPIVWGAVAALLLVRLLFVHRRTASLARFGETWRRAGDVEAKLSAEVDVPAVCGVARPVVLLPVGVLQWPDDRLEFVLRHEAAHARRRDTLTQFLADLACAAYWPLPWVWAAAARVRREAELACDDGVLLSGGRASDYAGHLIDIVRGLNGRERIPQGGIPMSRINDLEHRLRAMLSANLSRRPAGRGAVLAIGAAALALSVPLAAFHLHALAADGGLRGVVRDASGATVPKARVTVTFPDSSRKEVAVTNDTGEFSVSPLPDGNYNVSVAKPGFALIEFKGIQLMKGESQPLQIILLPGRIQETVTVVGEGAPRSAGRPVPAGPPQRIRVGGNVQAVKLVSKVDPAYPPACKAEGIEGSVVMQAVISKEGDVIKLEVLNQLVDPRLVEAAVEAVKQWKYQPTLLNGAPIEVVTQVDVNFILQK